MQPMSIAKPNLWTVSLNQRRTGFLSGLYDETIGGIVNQAKTAQPPSVGEVAARAVLGPAGSILDPNHPVWSILSETLKQTKVAINHGIASAKAEGAGLRQLYKETVTKQAGRPRLLVARRRKQPVMLWLHRFRLSGLLLRNFW
jgi:hypothetical protein